MAARTIRRRRSGFWPEAQNKARGVVPPGRRARENQPTPRTASTGRARKPPSAAFDWRFSFRLIGRSKLSKSKLATLGHRRRYRGRKRSADRWLGRLLTRAVAAPILV